MKNFYRFSAPDDIGGEQVVDSGPSTNHPTGRQRQTKQSRIKGEPQERNKPVVDDEEVICGLSLLNFDLLGLAHH